MDPMWPANISGVLDSFQVSHGDITANSDNCNFFWLSIMLAKLEAHIGELLNLISVNPFYVHYNSVVTAVLNK